MIRYLIDNPDKNATEIAANLPYSAKAVRYGIRRAMTTSPKLIVSSPNFKDMRRKYYSVNKMFHFSQEVIDMLEKNGKHMGENSVVRKVISSHGISEGNGAKTHSRNRRSGNAPEIDALLLQMIETVKTTHIGT